MCGCGNKLSKCKFWGRDTFNFLLELSAANLIILRKERSKSTNRNFILKVLGLGRFLLARTKNFEKFSSTLYNKIFEHKEIDVIIDSSKDVYYVWFLSKILKHDIFVIHLLRDPRASINSLKKSNEKGSLFRWIITHQFCKLLKKEPQLKFISLRYEDFVCDPNKFLSQVMSFVNVKAFQNPIKNKEVTLYQNHTINGNPNRFKTGLIKIAANESWKTEMNKIEKYLITLSTLPFLIKNKYI